MLALLGLLAIGWMPLAAVTSDEGAAEPATPVETSGAYAGPVVLFRGHSMQQAEYLLDCYNATASHPDVMVPTLEAVLLGSKRGMQAWLTVTPYVGDKHLMQKYPLVQEGDALVLYLPTIPMADAWRERVQRFVDYWPQPPQNPAPYLWIVAWLSTALVLIVFIAVILVQGRNKNTVMN